MGSTTHTPKDAKVMASILKDCGINEYEPRVINQMLEFAYRYVSDLLEDSKVYSDYANKKQIDVEDVKLAIQMKVDNTFTSPPPKELLLEIAKEKNAQPLPALKQQSGLRLPPDRYCLTQPNYRLKAGVHHTLINTTESKPPAVRYPTTNIKKEPQSTTTPLLPPIKAQSSLHPVQSAPNLIQPRAAAPVTNQTFIISAATNAEATSAPSSHTVSVPPPVTAAAGPSKSLFRLVSGASDSTAGSSNAASTSVSIKRKVEPIDEGLPTVAKRKYEQLDEDYDNL